VFDAQMKFTGREYTTTFAWLAMAGIFIPAVTIVVSPGRLGVTLAGIGIIACVALAWIIWKKSSRLTIPSIAKSEGGSNG